MIYTWQSGLWANLLGNLDRLPHALLVAGPGGIGKRSFANALAARLLCERATGSAAACGQCPACLWIAAGSHPDLRLVQPQEDPAEDAGEGAEENPPAKLKRGVRPIVIDQVRALQDFIGMSAHRRGWRVVIVEPAEAMNSAAANSILKMLEEPTPSTLFLMISDQPKRLLPTLRSRCRTVVFGKPGRAPAIDWLRGQGIEQPESELAFAGGYPLRAAEFAGSGLAAYRKQFVTGLAGGAEVDPIALAARCEAWMRGREVAALTLTVLTDWLQRWLYDLIAVCTGGSARYHPGERQILAQLAGRARIDAVIGCYNEALRFRRASEHTLNPRLFLEDMLLRYQRCVAPPHPGS
jgi:DNA polymerase-3 subunit delta'